MYPHSTTPEQWRPVAGYEGTYEVSDLGSVRRIAGGRGATTGRIRRDVPTVTGYRRIVLWRRNQGTRFRVHRLVLTAFRGPGTGLQANHINGNKADNRIANLEWVTPATNTSHAIENRLRRMLGETNHKARLTEADVRIIRATPRGPGILPALAARFGVSVAAISDVRRRRSWRHVVP